MCFNGVNKNSSSAMSRAERRSKQSPMHCATSVCWLEMLLSLVTIRHGLLPTRFDRLTNFNETITLLPSRSHLPQGAIDFLL